MANRSKWTSQLRLLLWKSWLISRRNWKGTTIQLLAPFFLVLALFVLQIGTNKGPVAVKLANDQRNPVAQQPASIPLCSSPKSQCWTIAFAPNGTVEQSVVYRLQQNNVPPIPNSSVISFATSAELDDHLFTKQNQTQGAYLFAFDVNVRDFNYSLQINLTDSYTFNTLVPHQTYITLPMQYAVDRSIFTEATQRTSGLTYSVADLPRPGVSLRDIVRTQGPLFFFAAIMFNLVFGLSAIVSEKQLKLRSIMSIMGLYDSAYWTAWGVQLTLYVTLSVFVLIISGCIFQFNFFLKNNFGLYFLLLELFGLTMVSLTFLVSTVVEKAESATLVGFCVFVIGFFMQIAAAIVFASGPKVLKVIFSLFSPAILQIGLGNLAQATGQPGSTGLSWSDRSLQMNSMSFEEAYGWLILDALLYLAIGLYLDNVLPNAYGVSKRWYYLFTTSYWRGGRSNVIAGKEHILSEADISEMDEDVRVERSAILDGDVGQDTEVVIKNLVKRYSSPEEDKRWFSACRPTPQQTAVKSVCLSMQRDTLTCLLGPNGAGKTTTIHMLCGFHQVSAGDATVFGHSVAAEMTTIQGFMGVCPQFDILWDELSGEEHLYLFAQLRGISSELIDDEVVRLLKSVDLTSSKNLRSSSYSGGMKRRLSVSISLIGDPKIVYLDEPTTGMDPVSRRQVWDVIEASKKGRVIILTTHSMEEADILGDKIAIMCKGQLQCLGSSLHLKQKFGAGYIINTSTKPGCSDDVTRFFTENIEGCTVTTGDSNVSEFLSFSVPRRSTPQLVPFFKKLEQNKEKMGIVDLQLGLTTLEEVFLTIAEKAELKELEAAINSPVVDSPSTHPIDIPAPPPLPPQDPLTPSQVYSTQFRALFNKIMIQQKREKKTIICQLTTPPLLILALFIFQRVLSKIGDPIDVPESRVGINFPPFQFLTKLTDDYTPPSNLSPQIYYSGASGVSLGDYTQPGSGLLGGIRQPIYNSTIKTLFIRTSPGSFSSTQQYLSGIARAPNFIDQFVSFDSQAAMNEDIFNSVLDGPSITNAYYFTQVDFTNLNLEFTSYYNDTLGNGDELPYLINRITSSFTLQCAQPYRSNLVAMRSYPQKQATIGTIDIVSFGAPLLTMLILQQLFPVFLTNIVADKESRSMEVMNMMGMKMPIYWIVQYVWNYALYLGVMFFMVIFSLILRFPFLLYNSPSSWLILYLIWGHVLIALSFFASIFFTQGQTSLVVGYFYVIGSAILAMPVMSGVVGSVTTADPATVFGVSVVPPFAFYRGLYYLTLMVTTGNRGYGKSATITTPEVSMASVFGFLVVEWLVLMLLWSYLHQIIPSGWGVPKHPLWLFRSKKSKANTKDLDLETPRSSTADMPLDVVSARRKAFDEESASRYGIRVMNLKKTYPGTDGNPPKKAVRGVSFAVPNNSCLGVLGHNGAGKTTTIHMLIGLFPPTSGTAIIDGKNIDIELRDIRTVMGICPQHDVLWPTLTGIEHLNFYGILKGLSGDRLKHLVEVALKGVNLWSARNKQSNKYSGGMRRRLSVAISVLGNPKVIYLDEPSTGLDPKSRQELWGVISDAKKNAAVILTTHSMEEADALCDEIMIMKGGKISCIGPSGDLKGRFGDNFRLSTQVSRGHSDIPAHNFVRNLVPQATLLNELAGYRNYEIPRVAVSLERIFQELEANKGALNICDWAITNTTLEEVFLKISLEHHQPKTVMTDNFLVEPMDVEQ